MLPQPKWQRSGACYRCAEKSPTSSASLVEGRTVRRSSSTRSSLDARDDRRRQAAQPRLECVGGQRRLSRSRRATSAARRRARCRRRSPTCPARSRRASRSPRRALTASASARARISSARHRQHALDRHRRRRAAGGVLGQRRLERGVGHLVDAQRAHQRMRADAVDQRRASDDDAGLRSAEELVAAEAADVDARRDRSPRPPAPCQEGQTRV